MIRPRAGSPAMVLVTVCIAQFMAPFMVTSVGVALPSLGRELGATAMQLGLVEQLYVLSMAMGMLTFGRLGDIIGQRRVLLLNATYEPLHAISGRRAIVLLLRERAEVLHKDVTVKLADLAALLGR